jgi:zinc and cadmium transporter
MLAGFATFFALEQFLHWHNCNRAPADCRRPLTYLIPVGDALHNFLGGLAVARTFYWTSVSGRPHGSLLQPTRYHKSWVSSES